MRGAVTLRPLPPTCTETGTALGKTEAEEDSGFEGIVPPTRPHRAQKPRLCQMWWWSDAPEVW